LAGFGFDIADFDPVGADVANRARRRIEVHLQDLDAASGAASEPRVGTDVAIVDDEEVGLLGLSAVIRPRARVGAQWGGQRHFERIAEIGDWRA